MNPRRRLEVTEMPTKKVYRDAGDGRFTTKQDVQARPGRTVTQTVLAPKKK